MSRAARVALAVALGVALGAGTTLALQRPPGERGGPPDPPPGRSTPSPPSEDEPPSAPSDDAEERVMGEAPLPTVLAWTPGGLPDGYADAVRRLAVVRSAAEVRSGTVWLDAWTTADGDRRSAPPGFRIPIEAAAVHPRTYAAFVPPAERALVEGLRDGGALLSRTAAVLRGVSEGGRLRIGDRTLRIEGVLDDELLGAHEVVVDEPVGSALGVTSPRYLLVEPRRGTTRGQVERALRRALPAGIRVRIRGPGETPVFRHGDAVLPALRLKELFGEFAARPADGGTIGPDPEWVEEHILDARMPVLGTVRCHRAMLPMLRRALADLTRRGLDHLIDPGDYGGCYSPRFLNRNPAAGLSHHAWGIAIDLNVSGNRFGAEPTMDPRVVEVFERHGFTWGGRWLVPDGMHFEFLRFPSG